MARNTSISLGEHHTDFIERQIADGRYASASKVVRAGWRVLEEHEAKLAALRASLVAGEQSSGTPRAFDFNEFVGVKRSEASG